MHQRHLARGFHALHQPRQAENGAKQKKHHLALAFQGGGKVLFIFHRRNHRAIHQPLPAYLQLVQRNHSLIQELFKTGGGTNSGPFRPFLW